MRRPKLYLHCGLPKTGSTALQSWFWHHRAALDRAGLVYPKDPKVVEGKHGYLIAELRRNTRLPKLARALRGVTVGRDVLLSNEGLSNHFDDFAPAALQTFRALTADYEVNLILLRRPQAAWIRSYYRQAVLNPANGASPLWGTDLSFELFAQHERVQRLADIDGLAQDLQHGFGARHVHRIEFGGQDLLRRVLTALGRPGLATTTLERTNESVPDWAIEVLRHINGVTVSREVRTAWRAVLCQHLGSNHAILRSAAADWAKRDVWASIDPSVLQTIPVNDEVARLIAAIAAAKPGRVRVS